MLTTLPQLKLWPVSIVLSTQYQQQKPVLSPETEIPAERAKLHAATPFTPRTIKGP
jgi:hypothetical protein